MWPGPITRCDLGPYGFEMERYEQEQAMDGRLTQAHRTRTERHDMARTSEMIDSKYMKQSDVPDPVIVTISRLGKVNLAKEGDAPEEKWAIRFKEFNKPMLLNSTNIKLLEKACGSDDTDDWIGKEVVLYNDENVTFGGNVVGGLRIRKQQAEPTRRVLAGATSGTGFDTMADDDIPF